MLLVGRLPKVAAIDFWVGDARNRMNKEARRGTEGVSQGTDPKARRGKSGGVKDNRERER